jgi:excisionase family DNA binding protein
MPQYAIAADLGIPKTTLSKYVRRYGKLQPEQERRLAEFLGLREAPQEVAELCAYLRIGRSTAYDLIRRKELVCARFGRVIRIPRTALERYVIGDTSIDG